MAVPAIVWLIGLATGCTMANPLYSPTENDGGIEGGSEGENESGIGDNTSPSQPKLAGVVESDGNEGTFRILDLETRIFRASPTFQTHPQATVKAFENQFYIVNPDPINSITIVEPVSEQISEVHADDDSNPTDSVVINGIPYITFKGSRQLGRINPVSSRIDLQINLQEPNPSLLTELGGLLYVNSDRFMLVIDPTKYDINTVQFPYQTTGISVGPETNRIKMVSDEKENRVILSAPTRDPDSNGGGILLRYNVDTNTPSKSQWEWGTVALPSLRGGVDAWRNLGLGDIAVGGGEIFGVYNYFQTFQREGQWMSACHSTVYSLNNNNDVTVIYDRSFNTTEPSIDCAASPIKAIAWSESTQQLLIADSNLEATGVSLVNLNGAIIAGPFNIDGIPVSIATF